MAEVLPPRKKFGTHKPIEGFGNVTRYSKNKDNSQLSVDTWLSYAKEAYDTSTSFIDTNYRKDWENSILHFQNKHMQGSKYHSESYKFRSKMFRPKTRATVRQVEAATAAAFFSQLDVISFEPEDDKDPNQLAAAALRQELLNYRLSGKKQIPWFQVCVGAMQEAQIYGIVGSKQFWDYQEKDVEQEAEGVLDEFGQPALIKQKVKVKDQPDIKLYPIENMRFSPSAEWTDVVNTSPYFIGMEPLLIGDVRKKISSGEWEQVSESVLLTARNSAYDSTRQTRDGDKEDSTDARFSKALSDFDIVWVHENFMRIDGEEIQFYTLSTVARLSAPKPLSKAYLHGVRPFVVGTCVIEPHKAVPDSPIHLGKGTQKEANELVNTRLDNVKLVLNKRYLVKRGKQVDLQSLVRNVPASVTLVNDVQTDVLPMEFQDVTSSAYAEQDRVNVDFDELLGSFSAGSIATNRKLGETVGGLQMLRGTSNTMGQYLIRVFSETWVEKVLNQLDELEQYYESDIELLNLMGRRANISKYGIEAVTKDILMAPARVTVNVANSAQDPTVRLELFTFAMQKYAEFRQNMPPDMDPEPVKAYIFGLLGFRDASRFTKDKDGNPELAAAQQMIQQLQQALESKMAEIKANNEAKFAAIEAKRDESMAKIQNEREIRAVELETEDNRLAAEIEAEDNRKSAELMQKDQQAKREADLKLIVAQLQEANSKQIAELQEANAQQMASLHERVVAAIAENSDETKLLIAEMNNKTQERVASMRPNEGA
jgi:hypothetical protein